MLRLVQVAVLIRAAVEGAVIVRSISSSRHYRRGGGGGAVVLVFSAKIRFLLRCLLDIYFLNLYNVIKCNWYIVVAT